MTTAPITGTWFDGRSAAGNPVALAIDGTTLAATLADGEARRWALRDVTVAEGFEHAPRMLRLDDEGVIEVTAGTGDLAVALRAAGVQDGPVVRMQRHRYAAVLGLVLCIAVGIFAYDAGLPAAARVAAEHVPPEVEQRIGAQLRDHADDMFLKPSRLPAERTASLDRRFAQLAAQAAPGVTYQVVWRRMYDLHAINAFTLPGGTIVMLDGLTDVASDDALVGVFAHELGHVVHRHTLRQMFQVAGIGGAVGLVFGDASATLTTVAAMVLTVGYSRDMEREADAFAATALKASGIPVEPLAEFLATMQAREDERGQVPQFLSTHPVSSERIDALRRAAGTAASVRPVAPP
ncbi:MAG: M48 family metallopeptidase [Proteobacteria bacterium]|nr:M48 family metallopeptidase [Pseudomonadota bacterium]